MLCYQLRHLLLLLLLSMLLQGGASQLDSVDAWAHFRDIPTTTLDMMLARMEVGASQGLSAET
jgi:hypothetical protein